MQLLDVDLRLEEFDTSGFTIFENVLTTTEVDTLVDAVHRFEKRSDPLTKTHQIRGKNTIRTVGLICKDHHFADLVSNYVLLEVIERILGTEFLLFNIFAVNIQPGEVAQALHTDDLTLDIPRPYSPKVVNVIFALTDFTEKNGATRLVPGSHMWADKPADNPIDAFARNEQRETIPAVMPRGSAIIYNGSLWHGGGQNKSSDERIGFSVAYSRGWMRTQHNFTLETPLDVARKFTPRLQQLCGFGLYKGVIGRVDGGSAMDVLLSPAKHKDDSE
jgi:ectoine hydroxylase-related dioxygenase (phytanoyl-CoA dioxygenase family)